MKFPKPARWALGLVLVLAVLKGGCEIGEEILEYAFKHHDPDPDQNVTTTTSANQRRVTSEIGRSSRVYAGDPKEKAWSYLKDNYSRLGLKESLDDLKIIDARANDFSINVELQQVFKGLPVENARLQVNFDKAGHVVQVVNSYTPPTNVSDQITVSKEQAENIVRQEFSRTTPIYVSKVDEQEQTGGVFVAAKDIALAEETKYDDVYFVRKEQMHRAYKTYIHAVKPFGIKEIITDAGNGDVLQIRDFVYNSVDGRGQVFGPDPVNHSGPSAYETVSLAGLDAPSAGPFELKGLYVGLENIEEPGNPVPTASPLPEFMGDRDSATFEDVMVYYHITRLQTYIQDTLRFTNVMNRRISADAHACHGGDNSKYVSSPNTRGAGQLLFGEGGVDDAEDVDVIAHEYGHAIQDNQTLGKYEIDSDETRAMAEGFGDYWAFSTTRPDPSDSSFDPQCLMEWDHASGCLRKIVLVKFKDDLDTHGDPHLNGQIWSATLFDIFRRFGKETADKLILQSHFNVPTGPNFEQGANAIITAALDLNEDNKIPELCVVFQKHHIYEPNHCPTPTH